MPINPIMYREIEKNDGQITTTQILKLGFSKTLITNYIKAGLLVRISHGIYSLPNKVVDDLFLLGNRSGKIIFSHDTALFLNNLSNRTPFTHSVTIPSNTSLSKEIKNECIYYYIKPDLHNLGLTEKKTTLGNMVRCYNAERTICDLLRSRSRCDEETVIAAIKNYANSKEKNLNLLAEYAKKLRVFSLLKKYLEVLL